MNDPLYEEAKKIVIKDRKSSVSYLQRKLHIGYFQCARFIDMMEDDKIVGPANGAKPREILIPKPH